jgi:hypothetical protein
MVSIRSLALPHSVDTDDQGSFNGGRRQGVNGTQSHFVVGAKDRVQALLRAEFLDVR